MYNLHTMEYTVSYLFYTENSKDMEIRIENIDISTMLPSRLPNSNFKFQVKVKITCPFFEFRWFPLDRQFCFVVLYSTHTDVDLNGYSMIS